MKSVVCGSVAALTLLVSAAAKADYAFDDFTEPGQGYYLYNGSTVCGNDNSYNVSFAATGYQFTSAATGSLTEIDAAIDLWAGTNSVMLELYSDNNNSVGTEMGSWTVNNEMLGVADPGSIVAALNSDTSIQLTAGTSYWVTAVAVDPSTFASWKNNNIGYTGMSAFSGDGTSWFLGDPGTSGAFSVQVAPAPEPVTMGLLGLGSLALIRRRSKRGR